MKVHKSLYILVGLCKENNFYFFFTGVLCCSLCIIHTLCYVLCIAMYVRVVMCVCVAMFNHAGVVLYVRVEIKHTIYCMRTYVLHYI